MSITMRNGSAKRVGRGAAVAAVGVALFMGLVATPAQAVSRTWLVKGPHRSTSAQAQADIPATAAECRRQDGRVVLSGLGKTVDDHYYAAVACGSKRG